MHGPQGTVITRLLLDTGATVSLLHPGILVRAGYDLSTPRAHLRVAAVHGTADVPLFTIRRITALGYERDNIAVLSHSLPRTVPYDGLLGLNFLRGRQLTIDFRSGVISLD